MDTNTIGLNAAYEAFLSRCDALNLAEGTVQWYRQVLHALITWSASRSVTDLRAITAPMLRDHLSNLRRRGQASETIFRTFGAMRCAFKFWKREGLIALNPMELVERPRRERYLIRPLSADQAMSLIAMPDTTCTDGLRDRAMIMLMLDSGLRISEALWLEAGRIDWQNRTLTVMGKGRKERAVPFSAETGQALLEYAAARERGLIQSPQFLLGRTGKRFCRCKARKLVQRYGKKAGIQGVRMSPHTLRHTFAVLYIRNGGDSFSLQEILGHSTLGMTRHYVNLARRDVAEQHRKFAPIAALMNKKNQDF